MLAVLALCACFGHDKPEKPGWNLTFNDEFDEIRLDKQAWVPMDPWQQERNNELQAYVRNAFTVEDGILKINADRRQAGYDGKLREYVSGMRSPQCKVSYRDGHQRILDRCLSSREHNDNSMRWEKLLFAEKVYRFF